MTGSIPTLPSSPALGERDDVDGLETWEDPIPRRSQFTVQDLCDAFVAASKAQFSRRPKQPSREERAKRIEERQRNILLTALKKYAKQNNIQPSELEFMEVKEMSLVVECPREYVHYNFLVKRGFSDGEPTMFFAEVKPNCKGEGDVYHCTPLEKTDSGHCFACNHGAKDLMHPNAGGYLGGHKEKGSFHMELVLDSDDDVCYL
ncbi:hypothetical protein QYE76_071021 [Lolium multiflorum]|uniref:DUF3615 domain-containing protein n=1 Tax=Lolium multiflorum TaxID=4521 RepID=A0AAD8SKR7_LOLMU|nr:hypothetical protein QYE76_071021 [Lolium multiflorum]